MGSQPPPDDFVQLGIRLGLPEQRRTAGRLPLGGDVLQSETVYRTHVVS